MVSEFILCCDSTEMNIELEAVQEIISMLLPFSILIQADFTTPVSDHAAKHKIHFATLVQLDMERAL